MRVVVDAQLPPVLVRLLAAAGHQAEHVAEAGMRDAEDSLIWQYAIDQQAIIVTKDEDFALSVFFETKGILSEQTILAGGDVVWMASRSARLREGPGPR